MSSNFRINSTYYKTRYSSPAKKKTSNALPATPESTVFEEGDEAQVSQTAMQYGRMQDIEKCETSLEKFNRLATGIFTADDRFFPTNASLLGLHQGDGRLESYTPQNIKYYQETYLDFAKALNSVNYAQLPYPKKAEYIIIKSHLAARKNELMRSKSWQRDPAFYPGLALDSVYRLFTRDYAPLEARIKSAICRLSDLELIKNTLEQKGTFVFPLMDTGFFSAARLKNEAQYTGYDKVWVRDNIHIAHSLYQNGKILSAVKNLKALLAYFKKHKHRFENIINGKADPQNPMHRPHIKFNGLTLEENQEKWAHAQNDALGYFVWFYCKAVLAGMISPGKEEASVLLLFLQYWEAVKYWQDEDSGHWEEGRKISASSIGAVTSALKLLKKVLIKGLPGVENPEKWIKRIDSLLLKGEEALEEILPAECVQPHPLKQRRHDAALLFLIYPLETLSPEKAELILEEVKTNLQGEYGIRRYRGDSYWCADYKDKLPPAERTTDFSDDLEGRDSLLLPGQEAQWCIFDPIISAIHGQNYLKTKDPEQLKLQTLYLNRSLGQLTGEDSGFPPYLCPEMYYLEKGAYRPNDVTPLLWTQANLYLALKALQKSLAEV